jgi:uncharacterized protein (TIGR00730 family)
MAKKNNIYDSKEKENPFHFNGQPREYKTPEVEKSYHNPEFMNSGDARVLRLMAEYLETESRLKHFSIKDTVVFYGSARTPSREEAEKQLQAAELEAKAMTDISETVSAKIKSAQQQIKISRFYEDARSLAFKLAEWTLTLEDDKRFIVCSGGGPGIMEAANRGASEAGSPTIGMNISLPFEQAPNNYISENLSFDFHYFFMRKFWFVYLAKALVVFPGGFGTFDELFELLTLRQTLKVKKPMCVVVYGKEYWEQVVNFEKMVEWNVISAEDLNLFHLVDTVDEAFSTLRNHFEREFVGKPKYWHW